MASETPSVEWDLDKLGDYARKLVRRVKMAPRRVAKDVFRMGQALVIVRDRLKAEGEYGRWCATNKIPKTTAHHAVKLFEFYGTEDKLRGKTIAVAKRECGLIKSKATSLPAFVQADAPKPIIRLDAAVKAIIDAGEDIANRDDFRQLVAELVKLADLNAVETPKHKGRKARVG
jgi:hypothetical protein